MTPADEAWHGSRVASWSGRGSTSRPRRCVSCWARRRVWWKDIPTSRDRDAPRPGKARADAVWRGDTVGRPLELGRAVWKFSSGAEWRRPSPRRASGPPPARRPCFTGGPPGQPFYYLAEQRAATGLVPDDRPLVQRSARTGRLGCSWCIRPFGARLTVLGTGGAARLREQRGITRRSRSRPTASCPRA